MTEQIGDQLIIGIDKDVWRQFTGTCKIKNIKVGTELTRILEEYLEKE